MVTSEKIFSAIYHDGAWKKDLKGVGVSGTGSGLLEGFPFILLMNLFLKTHRIRSVVDAGCGDWVLAKQIKWGKRSYTGIDIVKDLIRKNHEEYHLPHRCFLQLDVTKDRLPDADLLICKDVMIHLPLKEIFQLLEKTKKYRYRVFVNDINPENRLQNQEIPMGKFRPLDLTRPPFNLAPAHQTSYPSGCTTKQALIL